MTTKEGPSKNTPKNTSKDEEPVIVTNKELKEIIGYVDPKPDDLEIRPEEYNLAITDLETNKTVVVKLPDKVLVKLLEIPRFENYKIEKTNEKETTKIQSQARLFKHATPRTILTFMLILNDKEKAGTFLQKVSKYFENTGDYDDFVKYFYDYERGPGVIDPGHLYSNYKYYIDYLPTSKAKTQVIVVNIPNEITCDEELYPREWVIKYSILNAGEYNWRSQLIYDKHYFTVLKCAYDEDTKEIEAKYEEDKKNSGEKYAKAHMLPATERYPRYKRLLMYALTEAMEANKQHLVDALIESINYSDGQRVYFSVPREFEKMIRTEAEDLRVKMYPKMKSINTRFFL